jgi:hypothetical protein
MPAWVVGISRKLNTAVSGNQFPAEENLTAPSSGGLACVARCGQSAVGVGPNVAHPTTSTRVHTTTRELRMSHAAPRSRR